MGSGLGVALSDNIIQIPCFEPRGYQVDFLRAMDNGCKRAVLVWHRRAGKEVSCFNYMIRQAYWHRIGTYVYFFPTSTLGRRILWDGVDKEGKRFIDYIPSSIREGNINNNEMKIRLKNGSVIQIIGSDQIINVGINPVGCVFSEFSLQDPKCWNFIRPILRENDGWAVFNFTPRGKNHAYDLFLMAQRNEEWFTQNLTINDTNVLSEEDMESERLEGMSEHLIQQEYYCSFDQGAEGAYYAKYLNKAELEGRICNVPYDPHSAVNSYWDLGVSDETVILLAQSCGNEIHIINMYRNQGEGLQHYIKWLRDQEEKHQYVFGDHFAPHDIQVREFAAGAQTRLQIAKDLGINFRIAPNIPISEGIETVRGMFPRFWIDNGKCSYLIKAIENYHKSYNERLNVYSERPLHDWSSHSCFVGGTIVSSDRGLVPIKDIKVGDYVLTPNGKKKVINKYIKLASFINRIETQSSFIECTPQHEVFTETGLEFADALRYNTLLLSQGDNICSGSNYHGENIGFRESFLLEKTNNRLYMMVMYIASIKTITSELLQLLTHILIYIELFGQSIMGQFQKVITFIILMEIQKTTPLIILNVFRQKSILANIYQMKEKKDQEQAYIKRWSMQKYGILQKKGLSGIGNMLKKLVSGNLINFLKFVMSVRKNILALFTIKNFVLIAAKQKKEPDLEKITLKENAKYVQENLYAIDMLKDQRVQRNVQLNYHDKPVIVYDLEVEYDNCYYANGLLVSNCDAMRYLSVSQNKAQQKKMSEEEADRLEDKYFFRH